MTEHKAPPIHGYQDISQGKLDVVNALKQQEEGTLRLLEHVGTVPFEIDQRWLALARTHIQQGYMAAVRAVMQPQRISLPGDQQ